MKQQSKLHWICCFFCFLFFLQTFNRKVNLDNRRLKKNISRFDESLVLQPTDRQWGQYLVWSTHNNLRLLVVQRWTEHHYNGTAYLSFVADCAFYDHSVNVLLRTASRRIMHRVATVNHLKLISERWQWVHCSPVDSTVTGVQSKWHLWNETYTCTCNTHTMTTASQPHLKTHYCCI